MNTQPQPAPLAWHREAAKDWDERCHAWMPGSAMPTLPPVIAAHDPHAETVRLLEEAVKLASLSDDDWCDWHYDELNQIHTHLAKLKGTQ